MNKPHCEKCNSWYLVRDDDTTYNIQVVVCVICGERIYGGCIEKKVIKKDRGRKRVKQQWK